MTDASPDYSPSPSHTPDSPRHLVREALRQELLALGHAMASDTLGSRGELYIIGDNDLAAALFEFKDSAQEACDTMYQGSWIEGLPPRFAVLPRRAAQEDCFELIEQMRVVPLLYGFENDRVVFDGLEQVLEDNRLD